MKKYPKPPNSWWNKSSIISFFFAWNAFGILLYRRFTRKKNDPNLTPEQREAMEAAQLTFTQSYLKAVYGTTDERKFRHLKIKGFQVKESVDTTITELIKPKGEEKKENDTSSLQETKPLLTESS